MERLAGLLFLIQTTKAFGADITTHVMDAIFEMSPTSFLPKTIDLQREIAGGVLARFGPDHPTTFREEFNLGCVLAECHLVSEARRVFAALRERQPAASQALRERAEQALALLG